MIVQVTPIAIERIGWKTYIVFAALNATWVPIIFFFFPETKGLELEDVDRLFSRSESSSSFVGKVQIVSVAKNAPLDDSA